MLNSGGRAMKKFLKYLKWFAIAALMIIGAIFITKALRKATIGKIYKRKRFLPIPGNPNMINLINDEGKGEAVELPKGVKYRNVKAAGISKAGKAVVEIKHEKTDRRIAPSDSNPDPDDYVRAGRVRTTERKGSD